MSWMTRSMTVFVSAYAPGSSKGVRLSLHLKTPIYTRVWSIGWRIDTALRTTIG